MPVETTKIYPAEIAEYRDQLLKVITERRADAAASASRLPEKFALRIIDNAEYELSYLLGELLKLELFAVSTMVVSGDDIAKIDLPNIRQ